MLELEVKAFVYCTFQTPFVTEYYVPFVIAEIAILYNLGMELFKLRAAGVDDRQDTLLRNFATVLSLKNKA